MATLAAIAKKLKTDNPGCKFKILFKDHEAPFLVCWVDIDEMLMLGEDNPSIVGEMEGYIAVGDAFPDKENTRIVQVLITSGAALVNKALWKY